MVSKALVRSMNTKRGLFWSMHLFWSMKLSHSKYHVYSAPAQPEFALCLKDNSRKDLSCNWEEGNAHVVPAVWLTSLFLIEGDDQGIAEVVWHHLLLQNSKQDIVEGHKGIRALYLEDLSRDAILSWCSAGDCLVDRLLDLLDDRGFCERNSYRLLGSDSGCLSQLQSAEVLPPALAETLLVLDERLPVWQQ